MPRDANTLSGNHHRELCVTDSDDHRTGGTGSRLSGAEDFEDLLRRLAHELRTPLAAIAARAQVIRSEQFGPVGDAHYRSYAETIENSANLALQVLENAIQDVVAPDGEFLDDMILTDLSHTLNEVVDLIEPIAADFGVRLECTRMDPDCKSTTNPTYLKQILLNLITNAIKFTPKGGVVAVGLFGDAKRGSIIEVKDDGLGFAPAELARVLGASNDRRHGYGIVHELKRRCGGDLEIQSTRGQGTCVRLTLPVAATPSH